MMETYSSLMLIYGLLHIVTSEQECLYQYLRQPPSDVACNPYSTSDSLAIQCQISVPVASTAEIWWFHDDSQITEDSFAPLESITIEMEDSTSNRVITSTIVFDENTFNQQYGGTYYCKMVVNGNPYESSNALELLDEDSYIFLNPCMESNAAILEEASCVQSSATTVTSPVTTTTSPVTVTTVASSSDMTDRTTSIPPPDTPPSSRPPSSPSSSSPALPSVSSTTAGPTTNLFVTSTAAAPALWVYILIALVVALVLITISMAIGVAVLCHQVRTEGGDVTQKDEVETAETSKVCSEEGSGRVPLKEADVVASSHTRTNSYRTDPSPQAYDLTRHVSSSNGTEVWNHYDVAHPETQQEDHVGIELGQNIGPYTNVQMMQYTDLHV